MIPTHLPYEPKKVWYYDDIFPTEAPRRLIACFLHKNYALNLHAHDFYEINFIVKGSGVHFTEDGFTFANVGDLYIIPPGTYHGYHNIENLDVYHFLIHKNFFYKYYSDFNLLSAFSVLFKVDYKARSICANKEATCFNVQDNYDDILSTFQRLDAVDYKSQTQTSSTNLTSFYLLSYSTAISLVVKICDVYQNYFLTNETSDKFKGSVDLLRVIDYIHNNYHKKITLEIYRRV